MVQIGRAGRWGRERIVQLLPVNDPMIEPLLCGIVLGLIPVTLTGLFVAAWNQYRRGSALGG
jgi:cytochrome b6-f complex subunit 5